MIPLSRRNFLQSLAAAPLVVGASAAQTLALPTPDAAAQTAAVDRTVAVTLSPTPLNVGQQRHSAFPGIVDTPRGTWLVWREGSDHVVSRDGAIVEAWSTDGGASYGDVRVLRGAISGDHRDPYPSWIDNNARLSWFTGSAANPAQGAFTMTQFGPTARYDGFLPRAATTAPIVKLPNGQLGGAFYGRLAGESIDTAWMAWSSNGGLSWTTNRIANSIGAGVAHPEPFLLVDNELVHYFYRYGDHAALAVRTSTNSGLSGWDSARILYNATGRPAAVRVADGTIVVVNRELNTGAARIAYSLDRAQTWRDGGDLMASLGGIGMTYAAMVPRGPRSVYGVVGMEEAGGARSRLYRFELTTVG